MLFAPPPETPKLRVRQQQSRRRQFWRVVVTGLAVLTACGMVVWGFLRIKPFQESGQPGGPAHRSQEFNYRFRFPPSTWTADPDARKGLGANFSFRRTQPNSWVALLAKDYKDRSPRQGELIDEGVARLRHYFQGFEWEQKDDRQLGGEPARRLVFQGQVDEVLMSGECLATTHQGYGYWFVAWTPTADAGTITSIASEWKELRDGFALENDREGWAEKQPTLITGEGEKAPYRIKFTEGLWDRRTAASFDVQADMALVGRNPSQPPGVLHEGRILVLLLPPQPDVKAAVAAAREYLTEKKKSEIPTSLVESLNDREGNPDERPLKVGRSTGRVVRLRHQVPESGIQHFEEVAVIPSAKANVVIWSECRMERRSLWESEFTQVIESFQWRESPG